MLINIADLDALLTRQTRRVSILCFADVDALAALCILRDHFKAIHLGYSFSILVFVNQLEDELKDLEKTLSAPDATGLGDLIVLLNLGSDVDIPSLTKVRVLLIDYHKPVFIGNVFSETVYVLDDGVVSGSIRACFQKKAAARMVQSSLHSGDPGVKRLISEPDNSVPRPRRRRRRRKVARTARPGPAMNQGLFSNDSEDDIVSLSAMNLSSAGRSVADGTASPKEAPRTVDDALPGVLKAENLAAASEDRDPPPDLVVSDLSAPEASQPAGEPSGETLGSQDSTNLESDEYYYSEEYSSSDSAGNEASEPAAPTADEYTYEEYYVELSDQSAGPDIGGPENLQEALDFSDLEEERQVRSLRSHLLRTATRVMDGRAGDEGGPASPPRGSSPSSSGTDLDVSANLLSDNQDEGDIHELSFVVSNAPGEPGSDAGSEGAGHRQVARLLAERDEGHHRGAEQGVQHRPRVRVKRRRRVRKVRRWGEDGPEGGGGRRVRSREYENGGPDAIGDDFQDDEDARMLRHLRKYAPTSENLDSTLTLRSIQSTLSAEEIGSLQSGLRALVDAGDPASDQRARAVMQAYGDVICQSQPSASLLARYVLSFSSSLQPDNLYLREKVCWQGFLGLAWAVSAQIARCESFVSFWKDYRYIVHSRPVHIHADASLAESVLLSVADSFARSETQTPINSVRTRSGANSVPFMISPSLNGQDPSTTGFRDSPSSRARSASPMVDRERGFRPLGTSQAGSSLADVYNPRIFSSLTPGSSFPTSVPAGRLGIQSVLRGIESSRVETGFAFYDRGSPEAGRNAQIAPVARPRPYFVEIDPALFLFRLSSLSDSLMASSFSTVAALYRIHSRSGRESRAMLRSTLASTVITHMGVPNPVAQKAFTDLPKRKREAIVARYLSLVARSGAGRYSLATIPNVVIESSNERFEVSVFDHAHLIDALISAMGTSLHRLRAALDPTEGQEDVETSTRGVGLRGLLSLAGASPEDLLLMLSPEAGGANRAILIAAISSALEQQRVVTASEEKLRGKFQAQKVVPLLYSSSMDLPDTIFLSSLSLISRVLADCRSTLAGMKRLSLEYKYVSVEAEEVQGRALRAHASLQAPGQQDPQANPQPTPKTVFTEIMGSAASMPAFSKRTLPRERSFEEIRASLSLLLTVKGGETGVVAAQSTRTGLVEGLFGNAIPGLRIALERLEEAKRIPILEEFCPDEVLIRRGECGAVGALLREKLAEKAHPAGWLGG